ncbi:FBP domain-containing protein [Nocardiopsis trehalosi]|uniref:FBP domain-containing protein n=1 Tax=Nocardiopsis trehalosi TaxID=109329 RepID=UPI000836D3D2|nr:FBP domain-containing protein [Nocardiopsis trehalosi]
MEPLIEKDIRASFVNCSKGEAHRLPLPRDLGTRPWPDLDFLGWRDHQSPDRAYLVAEHGGRPVGVVLRSAARKRGFLHRGLCSVCLTTHPGSGVALMTARRAGRAGREHNSVGLYICADLGCPLYVRGLRTPEAGGRLDESLTVEEQVDRLRAALAAFLDRVTGAAPA